MDDPLTIRIARRSRVSRDSGESRWLEETEVLQLRDDLSINRSPLRQEPGSPEAPPRAPWRRSVRVLTPVLWLEIQLTSTLGEPMDAMRFGSGTSPVRNPGRSNLCWSRGTPRVTSEESPLRSLRL